MSISVKAKVAPIVNYAAMHTVAKLVSDVEITSGSTKEVVLKVRAVPEFFFDYEDTITLQSGSNILKEIKIIYNDEYYRHELIEAKDGEVKIEILDPEDKTKVLAFYNTPVHIQPYLHWNGAEYRYTMPAFMQPNDPLVAEVLKRAAEYANEQNVRMYGYQGRSRDSVYVQAEAIFKALQDTMIHYISAPAILDRGQKIRIPHMVLHEDSKQGTCLDLAVLYATCLEAADLNSVLIGIPGHAFAGVWLEDEQFLSSYYVSDRAEIISKRDANGGALMPVECTAYTNGKGWDFASAVKSARTSMDETNFAIDVKYCRRIGLNPVYTYTDKPICEPNQEQETPDTAKDNEEAQQKPDTEKEDKRRMESSDKQLTKLDKMKKQAMDFTLRNSLLSYKKDPLRLFMESFPAADFLNNRYDDLAFDRLIHELLMEQGVKEEALENIFGRMKINDRDEKKERGHGNLYLTLGNLHWKKDGDSKEYAAPLYLCPFEIDKNKRGEYICKADRSKIRFNLVLKEFLLQEYDIDIQELKDDPADNLEQEMAGLRYFIGKKKEWKVATDGASIGFYVIPNEAIYNGLSDKKLREHEIVGGLLDSKMTWEKDVEKRTVPENETGVYIFQSDSSQAAVIESAGSTKAQVVIGGAGNGKTQTIGNIVGEYIKAGKNVLMLTEKLSAAQVLKDLLASAGFGPFCLEVISGKNDVQNVIRQIDDSIHYMEDYEDSYEEDPTILKKYLEYKSKVEAFDRAMKEKGVCGKSVDELVRIHEKYKDIPCDIKWDKAKTAMNHPDAEYLVEGLAETVKYSGKKNNKYMEFLKCQSMSEAEKREAARAVEDAITALNSLNDAMEAFEHAVSCHFDSESEKAKLKKIVSASSTMVNCPEIGHGFQDLLNEKQTVKDEPENEILAYVEELKDSNPKSNRYKDAKKRMDNELKGILNLVERKKLLSREPEEIEEFILSKGLHLINKDGYDREKQEALDSKLRNYDRCIAKVQDSGEETKTLEKALYQIASGEGRHILKAAEEVVGKYRVYASCQSKAEALTVLNKDGFHTKYPDEMMAVLFQQWKLNANTEKRRKGYETIYKKAEEIGLTSILEQLEEQVEAEDMLSAFRKTWCEYNIGHIMSQIPELEDFDPTLYKIDIAHFKEYEKKLREEFRKCAVKNQMKRLPRVQDGAPDMPELGALNKQIRMNKKAVSIRSIFEQAPNLLFSMYPCMIMDPSAVAEYLPKDFPAFDMVIIDEGSQMPAYKALIPISKGRQCMIFGDEHQMTPTSFFKRQLEDEDGYLSAMESVLEEAIGCSMPKKMLKYHYRSEHESLIAFSNDKYYRNEIVTFPACDTAVKGVKHVFVENGCYDRGGKKTNEPEALRVIEEVKAIYGGLPEDTKETVGIVTLNLAQKSLIEQLLLKACVGDETLSRYVDKLVSVVNLESCQGREWSHVIISPAYGPDEKGEFLVNLGPIGKEDGGNRLNVLITRAKKSMHVVTSLQPEMIGRSSVSGTKDFRDFLSYARGSLQYDTRVKELSKEGDNLAQSIARAIKNLGYEVHTNIGASKCKVDIGVVSKEDPNTYLMGILLDRFGDAGFSVKDTEVIRAEVLKRKGWNVYRIHTLNWYEDAEYEAALIEKELNKLEGKSDE